MIYCALQPVIEDCCEKWLAAVIYQRAAVPWQKWLRAGLLALCVSIYGIWHCLTALSSFTSRVAVACGVDLE